MTSKTVKFATYAVIVLPPLLSLATVILMHETPEGWPLVSTGLISDQFYNNGLWWLLWSVLFIAALTSPLNVIAIQQRVTRRKKTISNSARIKAALAIASDCCGVEGSHHKAWVIDQMVRALTGCPTIEDTATDCRGEPYEYEQLGESDDYRKLVANATSDDDGPGAYEWDQGTAP